MYSGHPHLPLNMEMFAENIVNDHRKTETLVRDLIAEGVLQEHIKRISTTRYPLFPKVEQTVKATQETQKLQYLKRERGFDCSFKNGDTVLGYNMLQKTKKGHKMEDR